MLGGAPAAGQKVIWSPPPAESSSAAPAHKPAIIMDRAVCRYLPRHVPAADVEYRPGVDIQGRPIAPADLPGGTPLLPEVIEVAVTVPMAGHFGIPADALHFPEAYLGSVLVQGDQVLFNGQPIGEAAAHELVAVCARHGDR